MVDEVDVDACPGIQGGPHIPGSFLCFLVPGTYGGWLWGFVALEGLLLKDEDVQNPGCTLHHREFLEGGRGVLGVCQGWVVEVQEVDGGLCGCAPGL